MHIHIVIPVLDGARYLDAALRSIRAQSWANWSVSVRDAGSKDGSIDIAKCHAAEDGRVKICSEPDNGQYDAICKGLEAAPDGMLAWLNSDDLYFPWAFEAVARIHDLVQASWITGLPALWDSEGRLHAILPSSLHSRRLIRAGWRHDALLGCLQQESIFFHSSLWQSLSNNEKSNFAKARLAGDFYLWRCLARRACLASTPTVLGGFRVHSNNRSRVNANDYQREAESLGAFRPPRMIGQLIRNLYDAASAINTVLLFRRSAFHLNQSALKDNARD